MDDKPTYNYILHCAHCGNKIRYSTILGQTIFSCNGCSAETRFTNVGLTIKSQIELFKQRKL